MSPILRRKRNLTSTARKAGPGTEAERFDDDRRHLRRARSFTFTACLLFLAALQALANACTAGAGGFSSRFPTDRIGDPDGRARRRADVVETLRPQSPSFGSYTVPADGRAYSFPMHGVAHMQVWVSYSGGIDGRLELRLTRSDGQDLAAVSRDRLWAWNSLEYLRGRDIVFRRPVSGSKVTCRVVVESLSPGREIRIGLYRPVEVPRTLAAMRPVLGHYDIAADYSEDIHPERDRLVPGHLRLEALRGCFTPFHGIVDMGGNRRFVFDRDALRWAFGRYELRRWAYEYRQQRRVPEWGYIVFDHERRKWWRLCAFRRLRRDFLPSAWLFEGGMLVVINGFCSNLRIFRLFDGGVDRVAVPQRAIAGHMRKLAGRFHPDLDTTEEASVTATGLAVKWRRGRDFEYKLELRLTLRGGESYAVTYHVNRGKLVGTVTERLSGRIRGAL